MIWKRVIVAWMTLLALVLASAGASARTDVGAKPHVGAIDVVAAICIEAHGLASVGGHQENWLSTTTETSDVPDAARGASGILARSEAAGGHLIARHVGQTTEQLAARLAGNARLPAASTFNSLAQAEGAVGSALQANASQVSKWVAAGAGGRLVIDAPFSGGSVLMQGATSPVAGTGVRVVLQGNGSGGLSHPDGVSSAMSDRDYLLHQFFAGYFNQDWDVSGATNWSDVVGEYLSQNPIDDVLRTRDALRAWLSETEPGQRIPAKFGCEYDPGPDGMDDRTLVEAIADYIDERTGV
jgi:hypothetical protein